MARHHARSALAALAIGVALTATGCTTASGSAADADHAPAQLTSNSHAAQTRGTSAHGTTSATQTTTAPTAGNPVSTGKGTGSSAGKGTGASPWCTAGALSVSLRPGEPAAGNRYATLVLSNSSSHACRTQGYPGLQLTGKDGKPIPTRVVRDHSHAPRQLRLAPGQRASALLHWTVVPGTGDPADGICPRPAGLRVIPPDQRTADSAAWRLGEVCGTGKVEVLPLQAGKGAAR